MGVCLAPAHNCLNIYTCPPPPPPAPSSTSCSSYMFAHTLMVPQIHHSFPLFYYLIRTFKVQFAPQFYYFAAAFNVRIFTAKAVTRFIGTCTASSVASTSYICEGALGSSSDEWISANDGTSAWIRVQLSGPKYVTKLEIKSICSNYDKHKVKDVKVKFDDDSTQSVIIIYYVGWMDTLQWGGGGGLPTVIP